MQLERMTVVMTPARTLLTSESLCAAEHLECQVSGARVCIDSLCACDGVPNCGKYGKPALPPESDQNWATSLAAWKCPSVLVMNNLRVRRILLNLELHPLWSSTILPQAALTACHHHWSTHCRSLATSIPTLCFFDLREP